MSPLLSFFIATGVCHADDKDSALSSISPVYEEMLANEVLSLRRELTQEKGLKPEDPFFITGWGKSDEAPASRIVAILKQKYPEAARWEIGATPSPIPSPPLRHKDGGSVLWRKRGRGKAAEGEPRQRRGEGDHPFQGVILLTSDNPADWQKAASYIGIGGSESSGFLIIFTTVYMNRAWLDSTFEIFGFKVLNVMSSRELEFVEDELGRQIVDLDLPEYRNQIYERFVREGMNPVQAHPRTDNAIKNFRESQKPTILIIRKLTI